MVNTEKYKYVYKTKNMIFCLLMRRAGTVYSEGKFNMIYTLIY